MNPPHGCGKQLLLAQLRRQVTSATLQAVESAGIGGSHSGLIAVSGGSILRPNQSCPVMRMGNGPLGASSGTGTLAVTVAGAPSSTWTLVGATWQAELSRPYCA